MDHTLLLYCVPHSHNEIIVATSKHALPSEIIFVNKSYAY
jgi:hypothetical protein